METIQHSHFVTEHEELELKHLNVSFAILVHKVHVSTIQVNTASFLFCLSIHTPHRHMLTYILFHPTAYHLSCHDNY